MPKSRGNPFDRQEKVTSWHASYITYAPPPPPTSLELLYDEFHAADMARYWFRMTIPNTISWLGTSIAVPITWVTP